MKFLKTIAVIFMITNTIFGAPVPNQQQFQNQPFPPFPTFPAFPNFPNLPPLNLSSNFQTFPPFTFPNFPTLPPLNLSSNFATFPPFTFPTFPTFSPFNFSNNFPTFPTFTFRPFTLPTIFNNSNNFWTQQINNGTHSITAFSNGTVIIRPFASAKLASDNLPENAEKEESSEELLDKVLEEKEHLKDLVGNFNLEYLKPVFENWLSEYTNDPEVQKLYAFYKQYRNLSPEQMKDNLQKYLPNLVSYLQNKLPNEWLQKAINALNN